MGIWYKHRGIETTLRNSLVEKIDIIRIGNPTRIFAGFVFDATIKSCQIDTLDIITMSIHLAGTARTYRHAIVIITLAIIPYDSLDRDTLEHIRDQIGKSHLTNRASMVL